MLDLRLDCIKSYLFEYLSQGNIIIPLVSLYQQSFFQLRCGMHQLHTGWASQLHIAHDVRTLDIVLCYPRQRLSNQNTHIIASCEFFA